MRQIVVDTETTGLLPEAGHRIIEIACVELINRQITGNKFHYYLNPERPVDSDAFAITGLTNDFLQDKPTFSQIFADLLQFIEGTEIIAHNAPFDIGFLVKEITLLPQDPTVLTNKITVFDTLALARKMFPGQRNNLDALCKRYKVDNSDRTLHGALIDANLLAKVYLLMTGGQTSLFTVNEISNSNENNDTRKIKATKKRSLPIIYANEIELALHNTKLCAIQKNSASKKCLWKDNVK
jgi:DNA polymerase III subunit epsilon